MAKRKRKEQVMIYKTLHRKLQIKQHELFLKRGWHYVLRKGKKEGQTTQRPKDKRQRDN